MLTVTLRGLVWCYVGSLYGKQFLFEPSMKKTKYWFDHAPHIGGISDPVPYATDVSDGAIDLAPGVDKPRLQRHSHDRAKGDKKISEAFCYHRKCLTKYPDEVIARLVNPRILIPEAVFGNDKCPRCGQWLVWKQRWSRNERSTSN